MNFKNFPLIRNLYSPVSQVGESEGITIEPEIPSKNVPPLVRRLQIFGTSVRGPSHFEEDIPCQDACDYYISGNNGIIAISDGLGSARHSNIGSQFSVKNAVEFIKKNYLETLSPDTDIEEIVSNCIEETRNSLFRFSKINNYQIKDLACTLIIVLINDNRLSTAQIGDGAVVSSYNGEITLVSEPNDVEYRNEVIPLISDNWKLNVKINKVMDFKTVAVFTDGVQDGVMKKINRTWIANKESFDSLFSWAESETDDKEAIHELEDLLTNKFNAISNDDKTLVIAVR